MISNLNLYNISGKTIRRKISLELIWGVSISKSSYEFVIHVPSEYDYRYKSLEFRDLIVYNLVVAFKLFNGKPLQCLFSDHEDLESIT